MRAQPFLQVLVDSHHLDQIFADGLRESLVVGNIEAQAREQLRSRRNGGGERAVAVVAAAVVVSWHACWCRGDTIDSAMCGSLSPPLISDASCQ